MRTEYQQIVEVVMPFLVPSLAGVAAFLFIWLLLRHPLARVMDRLFPESGTSRPVRGTVLMPFGPPGAGSGMDPAGRGNGGGQRSEPAEGVRDGSVPATLDAARRELHLAEWQRAEAEFVLDPAEAVGRAERLLGELTRERGSTSVARALMREERSRLGAVHRPTAFGGDAEFGAALADAAVGIFRLIRQGRAAAQGRSAAVGHHGASTDDFRERMDLYRGVFGQLLGGDQGKFEALGAVAPAASGGAARDRPNRLHRRSHETLAERTARAWSFARWHVLQLALSLAFGLAVLVLVLWVLSL